MGFGYQQTQPPVAGSYSAIGRGRRTGLKSRATQILALRFGWVVLVVWYEVGEFFHSLSSCRFPDATLRGSTSTYAKTPPTHIVLLADPHVPHPILSYSEESRPWVNVLRQAMDELFMRKSWNVVMRLGRVDAVIVLGDMLDWGRGDMSEQEYENYFTLFHSIFRLPPSVPMYYVPGNHDLPLGPNRLFSPFARDRYARHFSPPNAILPVANHSLILLDAVGLVEEDYRRYAAEMQFGEWDGLEGGVIEFVKQLGDEPPEGPSILISHIPLARPEASRCGPLREKGRILKGAGPGYQNLLGSETTRFLLDVIRPSVVFSGDDHDYCELVHPSGIREVTIKSFSSSQGIRRPGFQLLSLIPPSDLNAYPRQLTHADSPCILPDQIGVYTRVYLPVAILTIVYLLYTNIRTAWQRWNAAGHSIYGDLKSRMSPGMTPMASPGFGPSGALGLTGGGGGLSGGGSDYTPTLSRRLSDRPVPLSLPSRKSSQQLNGLGYSTTPRSARSSFFSMAQSGHMNPNGYAYGGGGGGSGYASGSATPTGYGNSSQLLPYGGDYSSYFGGQSARRTHPSHSASAPVSPTLSPRHLANSNANDEYSQYPQAQQSNLSRMVEEEDVESISDNISVYELPTPSVSRRSSYIYMNGSSGGNAPAPLASRTNGHLNPGAGGGHEPNSYFLPLPTSNGHPNSSTSNNGYTTGNDSQHPSPHHGPIRRVASATFSAYSGYSNSNNNNANHNYVYPQPGSTSPAPGAGAGSGSGSGSHLHPPPPQPMRRVTMPRLISPSDWSSAAKAKDKSILGLLADSIPFTTSSSSHQTHQTSSRIGGGGNARYGPGFRGWINMLRAFAGWCWRSRHGVIWTSWSEVLGVAWPAALVWVGVNALFFWS